MARGRGLTACDDPGAGTGNVTPPAANFAPPFHLSPLPNMNCTALHCTVLLGESVVTALEGTTNASYTIVLGDAPTDPVTITPAISAGDADRVVFIPAAVTFTNSDWNSAQTVIIQLVDDADAHASPTTYVAVAVQHL